VDDVFEHVLARIEEDLGKKPVQRALEAIWASRSGLFQDELLSIAKLTPAQWAAIQIALDEALYDSGGKINFGHDYLRKGVEDKYLSKPQKKSATHLHLARKFYDFMYESGQNYRICEELPWQFLHAGKRQEVFKVLMISGMADKLYEIEGFYLFLWKYVDFTKSFVNIKFILVEILNSISARLGNGGIDLDKSLKRLLEIFYYLEGCKKRAPLNWGRLLDACITVFPIGFPIFKSGYIDIGVFSAVFADQIVDQANKLLKGARNLTPKQQEWLLLVAKTPVYPG
jgi:hypothetical protein